MMHIAGGKYRDKRLITEVKGFKAGYLRPTSGMARAAIFNVIGSLPMLEEGFLEKATVLDLFAGSGALGLEALSRGAASATFIDNNFSHLKICEKNIEHLTNGKEKTKLLCMDASALGKADKQYNLIFIDPPYKLLTAPLAKAENGDMKRNNTPKLRYFKGALIQESYDDFLPDDEEFTPKPHSSKPALASGIGLIDKCLTSLIAGNWIATENLIIIERSERDKLQLPQGFQLLVQKEYGAAALSFCRYNGL